MAAKAAGLEVEDEGSEDGHHGTGVMISQLRHFVIQVSRASRVAPGRARHFRWRVCC
jgi:hypothetical protein